MPDQLVTPKQKKHPANFNDQKLFVIPNPFEDYVNEKKGWFTDVRKLEDILKVTKEKLAELMKKQQASQHELKLIKAYCSTLPKIHSLKQTRKPI